MPTSPYFNNFKQRREQGLVADLVDESIKIHGYNVYYIPREDFVGTQPLSNLSENEKQQLGNPVNPIPINQFNDYSDNPDPAFGNERRPLIEFESGMVYDKLFGEHRNAVFKRHYVIDMYIDQVSGFKGEGTFFTKFGLELQDQIVFMCSVRNFRRVTKNKMKTPRPGDLLYIPMTPTLFEIKFVENKDPFFQLGDFYVFRLTAEAYRYNQDRFDTGVKEIDAIEDAFAYKQKLYFSTSAVGTFVKNEVVYQGSNLANSAVKAEVVEWNSLGKVLTVKNIKGEFTANANVVGVSSGTSITLARLSDPLEGASNIEADNIAIEKEADLILDTSVTNPMTGDRP